MVTIQPLEVHAPFDELKDDPSEVEAFTDGAHVVTTEGAVVEVSDKDLSRIESGHNGGEYTTDNTIIENASMNRARGAEDMTTNIQRSKLLISSNLLLLTVQRSSLLLLKLKLLLKLQLSSEVFEAVADGLLPITYGAKAAHSVWKATEHMEDGERLATTALAGGGQSWLPMVPCPSSPANLVLGGIAVWKLGSMAVNAMNEQTA